MTGPHSIMDALGRRLLILDGATGTGLMALRPDVDPGQGLERLCVEDPDSITALHTASLRAGCDLVRTNTFCGSAPELEHVGLAGRARELARLGAELARDAVNAERSSDDPAFLLGVIGPGAARFSGPGSPHLIAAERDRAFGLVDGGIDAFLIETVGSLEHLRVAVTAARESASILPVFASFSIASYQCLASGSSMAAVAHAATELGLDLIGLNCSRGPASLDEPLRALRRAWPGPLGAWPNAGLPIEVNGELTWPIGPDELARWLAATVREVDLRIAGGCCGTTAQHVEAIVSAHMR